MLALRKSPSAPPWQRPRYSRLARQWDVFSFAAKFIGTLWLDRTLGRGTSELKERRAQWLSRRLVRLGPAFIKVGQALSTRPDLLPLEYIRALGELQDSVPPFPVDAAIATIESELGRPVSELFQRFEPEPLAAASLGQVHRATLLDGTEVVVKVQRPGLQPLLDLDFKVLRQLIDLCDRRIPALRQYDLESIYLEFFRVLYQEIDYKREGQNADRFRENFTDYPQVIVPQIFWPYTTSKVLVMEYKPGIKIDDRAALESQGIDITNLNKLGICCYLKQILQDGFFQADPHPGNMAVAPDGAIIFYDFGMLVEVKSLAKDQMVRTLFAVLKQDTEAVLSTMVDMGFIEPNGDMRPVRRLLNFTLERFVERPIELQEFSVMRRELVSLFEQQPFRLPAQMVYILKSLTTLDGIARTLEPQYNLLALAKPFVKSLVGWDRAKKELEGSDRAPKGEGLGRKGWIEVAKQAGGLVWNRLNRPDETAKALRLLEERLDQGELEIRVRSEASDRALRRLNMGVKAAAYGSLSGFLFVGGAVLTLGPLAGWAGFAFGAAAIALVVTVRLLIKLELRERVDRLLD